MPDRAEMLRKLREAVGRDVGQRLNVFDPLLSNAAEVVIDPGDPGGSRETTRLTLHVPHDNTMLSLGKPSSDWRADEGVTVRTDNHIVLEIAKEVETFLSLGKPSVFGQLMGEYGFSPVVSNGYSMVTEGTAWSEAKLSHVVASRAGDAIVAAEDKGKVLLQSRSAQTLLSAQKGVCVGSPSSITVAAHSGIGLPELAYEVEVDDTLETTASDAVSGGAANVAMWLDNAVNLWGALEPVIGRLQSDKSSAEFTRTDRDVYGALIGSYNLAAGLGWVNELGSGPNVDITAERAVGISGGTSAGLYGHYAAGVGSMGFTSMFGMTAGVTGVLGLGLVGVKGAEMVSMGDAAVRAFGNGRVVGGSSAVLESSSGWVGVASMTHTQITSKGDTHVYGERTTALSAGKGAGYGLVAKPEELFVGKVKSSDDIGKAKPDKVAGLEVKDNQTKVISGDAEITLLHDGQMMFQGTKAFEAKVGATTIEMTKSKILLG